MRPVLKSVLRNSPMPPRTPSRIVWLVVALAASAILSLSALGEEPSHSLELSRAARPWEFLSATGTRAGLFGNEAGRFEAWVYPLKILRDFHLRFHSRGLELPADSLARMLTVRPESSSILYASDTFTVRETFFVPVHESGAIILLEVDTSEPLEIEAAFHRDFQLEWPASLGGSYMNWDPNLRAFVFSEEQKKFSALIGSPTADDARGEYQTNYSASQENSFRLGVTKKGHETKAIVIAASSQNQPEAEAEYRRLSTSYDALLTESAEYYRAYLGRTVNLKLPDQELQQAYDWSRISMIQGLVTNPTLGTGLVAGYRTSGDGQRPGFAWFFGRDALWTGLGLDAAGDTATTRTALEFLSKYQREDGKITHEIAQSANFVPWFKDFPYAYAAADATPLFIIATNDYVTRSGDVGFAKEQWPHLWSAYQFLRSTYDAQGLPQNFGFGHGWVEGGPLLPVKTELYQSGVGAEALRALSSLAGAAGKEDVRADLANQFARQRSLLNQSFWSQTQNSFAFALDKNDKQVNITSVLATVPMWFGLLDEAKAQAVISQLARPDHQTDWGMRIISSQDPHYGPDGYHFGAVWPLFTGWASTGEYRYHRALPAYANLRANALLSLDGSLGHVTEVLSGDYYQPVGSSSPHQIWSAAMVVNPLLRGLLGLDVDTLNHRVTFSPHIPADWRFASVSNLNVGASTMDLEYSRTADSIQLVSHVAGKDECSLEFAPALSLRAQVTGAEINGRSVPFRIQANTVDQHVSVNVPACAGPTKLLIHLRNDFGVSIPANLPPLGAASQGLRIMSESWTPARDQLTLQVSGVAGRQYELGILNSTQIASLAGAELVHSDHDQDKVRVQFPAGVTGAYSDRQVTFHFAPYNGGTSVNGSE